MSNLNENQAINLLEETFSNDFDMERFQRFTKELFNHIKIRENLIPLRKEYVDYAESVTSLGVYRDPNNDVMEVFAVKLKRTSSMTRARTMQRNLIARYLRQFNRKGALVAFYGENQDWRLSFVKIENQLFKDDNGNLKVKEDLTPAKRYSFLVGKNEPNHTCKKQFLDLIKQEDVDPSLREIENVFSIENVTKEFFDKYQALYLKLKKSLESVIKEDEELRKEFNQKNISNSDFSKKLMGQIVFIYFIQKKGWLGVKKDQPWGTGPKKFLRKLFDKEIVEYDNFFNDVLEPLFYDALSRVHEDNYYEPLNCKIPFLNGGLFETINEYNWKDTKILLDNEIFKKILKTFDKFNFTVKEDEPLDKEVAVDPEMLGKVFENLLEVKDRKSKGEYYTPREVVHYMCQESLINYLETNSDVPMEDIKEFIQLGDFALDLILREKNVYQRQLKWKKYGIPTSIKENYDLIDKLLKDIKVVDPAVGSGAFPVGMMNEIVKARSVLSVFSADDKKSYDLKRETIENSLFGVDIESSAVDITKLRFWLSLIVDEEDIENIKALPNLDHKIMCGNSLLEEFEGKKLFDDRLLGEIQNDYSKEIESVDKKIEALYILLGKIDTGKIKDEDSSKRDEISKKIKKLDKKREKLSSGPEEEVIQTTLFDEKVKNSQKKLKRLLDLQPKFFNEINKKAKEELRQEIERIEWEFIEETLKEEGNEESIKKLEKYKNDKSKPFFLWKLYFSDVFRRKNPGFDVAILNPPYLGEDSHKEIFRPVAQGNLKEFYQGKMDYFYFFFHLALNICREDSQIAFITTNYYPTASGAEKLRKDFKKRVTIRRLINFNELRIFESAKGQHNMITILTKNKDDTVIARNCETKRTGLANPQILNSILMNNDEQTEYYEVPQSVLYEGKKDYIRLIGTKNEDSISHNILNKIEKESTDLLGNVCDVNQGVISGCDKLTKKLIGKLSNKENFELKDGIFVFDLKNNRDLAVLNSFNNDEKKLLKPFFKNSEVTRFWCNTEQKKLLLYLNNEIKSLNQYPNIKRHLLTFKEILDDRLERYNEKYPWFNLHRSREQNIFESQKICVPYRSDVNSFAYNDIPWYCRSDCYIITKKNHEVNLKYLLAILNSKLYYIWLYHKGKRKGEKLELFQTPLSEIPIKQVNEEAKKPLLKLVNQILEITGDIDYPKNKNKKLKVRDLEKDIDNLVFDLYNLTSKEREFVIEFNKELFK